MTEAEAVVASLPSEVRKTMDLVAGWECLRGYPKTVEGVVSIARAFAAMCPEEKYEWLNERVLNGVEWCPTPLQLRRICTHGTRDNPGIRPLDGLDADTLDMEEIARDQE